MQYYDNINLPHPPWSDAPRVPDEDTKQAASKASPTSRRQQEDAKVFLKNHDPQSSSISSSSLRSRYSDDTSPLNRSKSVPKPFSSVSLSVPETVKKGRQFLMNTCFKRKRNVKPILIIPIPREKVAQKLMRIVTVLGRLAVIPLLPSETLTKLTDRGSTFTPWPTIFFQLFSKKIDLGPIKFKLRVNFLPNFFLSQPPSPKKISLSSADEQSGGGTCSVPKSDEGSVEDWVFGKQRS